MAHRSLRHLGFWVVVFVWNFVGLWSINYSGDVNTSTDLSIAEMFHRMKVFDFGGTSKAILLQFIFMVPYSYLVAYWFVPRLFMRRKHLSFAIWFLFLTCLNHAAMLYWWGFNWQMEPLDMLVLLWYSIISFVNNGAPITCGLLIGAKMLKTWYAEEQQKLILTRENANAELQLLKAQVHPHFLFNTLNNMYSFALDGSQKASQIITRLSAILEYMTHDCDDPFVLVDKEIQMIENYVGLEKVRYGARLSLEMKIEMNERDVKLIPPFLLIPFVENSFKHGASEELQNPWITLCICIKGDHLYFKITNSKPADGSDLKPKRGLGLSNVQKRLELLYPDRKNLLTIQNEKAFFEVTMNLPLIREPDLDRVGRSAALQMA